MRRDWFEAARPRLSGVGFKILVDVMVSGPRRPQAVEVETALRRRLGGASKLDFRVMADLAALLIEKRTKGVVSARLALFLGVGLTGVAVHLLTLRVAGAEGASFWLAQALAILTAMTSNFFVNNLMTFRDMRLRGAAMARGLVSFYVGCLGGAGLNELLAEAAKQLGAHWAAAALIGIVAGALFNYGAARRLTWPASATARRGAAAPAESSLTLQIAARLTGGPGTGTPPRGA
jgi:dolichol-phosphate mannosyltransferase